jgi:hypothetical protein
MRFSKRVLLTALLVSVVAACGSSSSESEGPSGQGGTGGSADAGWDGSVDAAGTGGGTADASDGGTADASDGGTKTLLKQFVITWYSFQDNTPVNSAFSSSGRTLIPYVSVAVPFTLLKDFGGTFNYGDKLYLEFLDGRAMPNGSNHTGWVQIDDFCGDNSDDSYCYQTVGGTKYPNTDLYIGDFTKSGMDSATCTGPAGDGQQITNVYIGNPGSAWTANYGGAAIGTGKCADKATAKSQQGAACWTYDDQPSDGCQDCDSSTCAM